MESIWHCIFAIVTEVGVQATPASCHSGPGPGIQAYRPLYEQGQTLENLPLDSGLQVVYQGTGRQHRHIREVLLRAWIPAAARMTLGKAEIARFLPEG